MSEFFKSAEYLRPDAAEREPPCHPSYERNSTTRSEAWISDIVANVSRCTTKISPTPLSYRSPFTMAVEITTGTPLANALQSLIQPKLEALEWIGGDDSTMSEYIVMMLASGKTQDEVASELFNDFQAMGVNEATALDFSRWLFEQVHALQNQESQQAQSSLGDAMQDIPVDSQSNTDAQMGDVTQSM